MKRRKVSVISPTACVCCYAQTASETHHRQPKSQRGSDEPDNLARACHDCHDLYHTITNQRLANTLKGRVQNFALWLAKWPDVKPEVCGKTHGPNPYIMAPGWVVQEWADAECAGHVMEDLSHGRLSNIPKVQVFKPRPPLGER